MDIVGEIAELGVGLAAVAAVAAAGERVAAVAAVHVNGTNQAAPATVGAAVAAEGAVVAAGTTGEGDGGRVRTTTTPLPPLPGSPSPTSRGIWCAARPLPMLVNFGEEQEANRFATELMRRSPRSQLPGVMSLLNLMPFKDKWGLSLGSVIMLKRDSVLIDVARADMLTAQLHSRINPVIGHL